LVSAGIAICLLFTAVALAPLLKEPSLQLLNLGLQLRDAFSADLHWPVFFAVAVVYLLSGLVKGLAGIGMGLIAVPVLSVIYNPMVAIASIAVPLIMTNLWQGVVTGNCRASVSKYWALAISMGVTMLIVSYYSIHFPASVFTSLLGMVAILFAIINLSPGMSRMIRLVVGAGSGKYRQILFGIISGVVGGMTGLAVIPLVIFMMCSDAKKEDIVSTLGLLLFVSGFCLLAGLSLNQIMTRDLLIYSCLATLPALLGVIAGEKLRALINESYFRKLVLVLIAAIGVKVVLAQVPTTLITLPFVPVDYLTIDLSTAALPN